MSRKASKFSYEELCEMWEKFKKDHKIFIENVFAAKSMVVPWDNSEYWWNWLEEMDFEYGWEND